MSDKNEGNAVEASGQTARSELEQRYIHILEQRIAQLEAIVAAAAASGPKPKDVSRKRSTSPAETRSTSRSSDRSVATAAADASEKSDPTVNIDQSSNPGKCDTEGGEDAQKQSRIRSVTNRNQWEDVEGSSEKNKIADPSEDQNVAVTFRRHMDMDNVRKVEYEEVELHSAELRALLSSADDRWRELFVDGITVLSVQSPFCDFVWGRDRLENACEQQDGDEPQKRQARGDLKNLLDTLRGSDTLKSYFRSLETIKTSKKIKFELLWTLFGHGILVYARSFLNEFQMFQVKSCSLPPIHDDSFRILCTAFDWDGSKFVPYECLFTIKKFAGDEAINSLAIFPTELYVDAKGVQDDSAMRRRLRERGLRYSEFCGAEPTTFQCGYEGTALVKASSLHKLNRRRQDTDVGNRGSDELDIVQIDISGAQSRIIIDNYSFLKSDTNPDSRGEYPPLGKRSCFPEVECDCLICKSSPLRRKSPSYAQLATNDIVKAFAAGDSDQILFLPPRLLGFALKEKVWAQFSVDRIKKINFNNADQKQTQPFFKELQLEQESKDLLMAFVEGRESPRPRKAGDHEDAKASDVIEGKGRGVAILLHGPPGVGKTLTAETIALATERPLLTVSVAEIGISPLEAEKRLESVFADAARWDAVLLMDEADVFVEERRKSDLDRNALVSVLLRCLEYFDGIIILTTNRVKAIDMAVQSRINLAIQYHDLTPEQRLQIYKNRLEAVPDDEIEDRRELMNNLKRSSITKKASKTNGRQIRNIVNGARALAKRDVGSTGLNIDHLETVADATLNFISTMDSLNQRQRAFNEADFEK